MEKRELRSSEDTAYWSDAALHLLKKMIATPSLSKQEDGVAEAIQQYIESYGVNTLRIKNNVIAFSKFFDPAKPSIVLNSHHDTVPPNTQYTKDPYHPAIEDEKLFGLGSNDAGGCLSCLIHTFLALYNTQLEYNLIIIASAEEEISGKNGVELVFNSEEFRSVYKGHPDDFAIVGEPTLMQMAVAERGLMVIDAVTKGIPGHAAREEGESALYKAVEDINFIKNHRFPLDSDLLGPVKTSVTVIQTENKAHNVVPDTCSYVIDCRINEKYTFQKVLDELSSHLHAQLTPRSMRLKSSMIPLDHPVVLAGISKGKTYYGSPTTSDKALIPLPALKMGPGDSARSHSADEFIFLKEIQKGVEEYINILLSLSSLKIKT
jgi:acetylornithine deacetylase